MSKMYPSVAEAKQSNQKRTTIAPNIQYDRISGSYIAVLYWKTENGKAIRKHETFHTRKEAQDRLTEHKESVRKGLTQAPPKKKTLGECISEYIQTAQIEETTAEGYLVQQKRIEKSPISKMRLSSIKKKDIDDYLTFTRQAETIKNATINKDLDLIRRVCEYAVEREYIPNNPAYAVKSLKEEKFEASPLTVEEIQRLIPAAEATENWTLIVMVHLGLYMGLRRGEVAGLRWSNVSFEDNIVKIRTTRTKVGGKIIEKPPKTSSSIRDLEMPKPVRDILQKHMEKQKENGIYGEYVLTDEDGQPVDPGNLGRPFNKLLKDCNIRHVRLHDLRHTFGTRAISAGISPVAVSGAMGHSSVATTLNIYVHSKALEGSRIVNADIEKIFG